MTDEGGTERRRRRLAAILMADVAGFTRLMGVDDERTTSRILDFHRQLKTLIEEHNGRVVATAGDSVFGEFGSILRALDCAASIQQSLHDTNVGVPENDRIEARIGLHLGDVIVEEYNVFGDGVNIAARLEALAAPGGILLSEAVYQQIEGRRDLPIRELGTRHLKNVEHPIRVYEIAPDAFQDEPPEPPPSQPRERRAIRPPWRAAIAAAVAAIVTVIVVIALAKGGGSDATEAAPSTEAPVASSTTTTTTTSTTSTTTTTTTTIAPPPIAPGPIRPDFTEFPPAPVGDTEGASGAGCILGGEAMWDGPWFGYVEALEDDEIEFDLGCFFAGEEAETAADEDGFTLLSPYYIRNDLERTRTLPIHRRAIVYYADGTALRGVRVAEWSDVGSSLCPGEDCSVWIYLNEGEVTAIVEFIAG